MNLDPRPYRDSEGLRYSSIEAIPDDKLDATFHDPRPEFDVDTGNLSLVTTIGVTISQESAGVPIPESFERAWIIPGKHLVVALAVGDLDSVTELTSTGLYMLKWSTDHSRGEGAR